MSSKWNDDWRYELKDKDYDCYIRLCECNNTFSDIKIIAKLMWKYNHYNPNLDIDIRDCVDRTVIWLCDWNEQLALYDKITEGDYELIVEIIEMESRYDRL